MSWAVFVTHCPKWGTRGGSHLTGRRLQVAPAPYIHTSRAEAWVPEATWMISTREDWFRQCV
ncbi:MAG: hypothetical protein NVSMB48_13830 [Marmoricola sp.]